MIMSYKVRQKAIRESKLMSTYSWLLGQDVECSWTEGLGFSLKNIGLRNGNQSSVTENPINNLLSNNNNVD